MTLGVWLASTGTFDAQQVASQVELNKGPHLPALVRVRTPLPRRAHLHYQSSVISPAPLVAAHCTSPAKVSRGHPVPRTFPSSDRECHPAPNSSVLTRLGLLPSNRPPTPLDPVGPLWTPAGWFSTPNLKRQQSIGALHLATGTRFSPLEVGSPMPPPLTSRPWCRSRRRG